MLYIHSRRTQKTAQLPNLTLEAGSLGHVHGQQDLDGAPGIPGQLLLSLWPRDVWRGDI